MGTGASQSHSDCIALFFPLLSLSDTGRVKFSTQIQERTRDNIAEGPWMTQLASGLTSFFLLLTMLIPFCPFSLPPNKLALH